ncbi:MULTISPECIES: hypothetical protein [unclassified Sphingomonas]|uniref:hypothetical protein n=1 Tax=Sphingomonas TaxID=13687 RepID=UPI00095B26B1|nr:MULTISPECIES: hypothetical protein [unclassified Sphingomonas]MBN8811831.1 hypothetical protein [Sphingomonas sp.]OJY52791.1 MAG: hypothetical protein BGP17_14695 [Sphingomonas sp. 67-41]
MIFGAFADAGRIAIVAHDAGAANHIFSWIGGEGGTYRVLVEGVAARLWVQRFGTAPAEMMLDAVLRDVDFVVTGTGWASDLEHAARKQARALGLRTAAVVDHWVNYRERFVRDGEEVLPDEIWVTDEYALAEARRRLDGVPIVLKPNWYLAEQVAAAGPPAVQGDLLFVAEPARDDWGRGNAGEFQTLDFLWAHRDVAGINAGVAMRIRPHPSDPPGKYDAWIAAHPGSRLDHSRDMGEALRSALWVAGLQSYALVIALASGRPAICALPPWAPPNRLPHTGLLKLRDVIGASGTEPL